MSEPLEGEVVGTPDSRLYPIRFTVSDREVQAQCRSCGAYLEVTSFAEVDAAMTAHVAEEHSAKPACSHLIRVCDYCGEEVE